MPSDFSVYFSSSEPTAKLSNSAEVLLSSKSPNSTRRRCFLSLVRSCMLSLPAHVMFCHHHHHHIYSPIITSSQYHKNNHTIGGLPEKPYSSLTGRPSKKINCPQIILSYNTQKNTKYKQKNNTVQVQQAMNNTTILYTMIIIVLIQ